MIVVANKTDLEDSRQVSTSQGQKLANENGKMLFIETSAKSNLNVEQAFQKIAQMALARQEQMQKESTDNLVNRKQSLDRGKFKTL